jgi:long-chain acyl-CoA synthetase
MNSDDELNGNTVGFNYLIKQGNILINNGNNSYMDIEVDPEEFRVLIFTSGTTSNSKGVMICNKNLAQNINAITAIIINNNFPKRLI